MRRHTLWDCKYWSESIITYQIVRLLSQSPGIQRPTINDDFDPFLVQQVDGLDQSVPCCWYPSGVFAFVVRIGVVAEIDLCKMCLVISLGRAVDTVIAT
jgi:hypothetical protein